MLSEKKSGAGCRVLGKKLRGAEPRVEKPPGSLIYCPPTGTSTPSPHSLLPLLRPSSAPAGRLPTLRNTCFQRRPGADRGGPGRSRAACRGPGAGADRWAGRIRGGSGRAGGGTGGNAPHLEARPDPGERRAPRGAEVEDRPGPIPASWKRGPIPASGSRLGLDSGEPRPRRDSRPGHTAGRFWVGLASLFSLSVSGGWARWQGRG